MPLLFLLYPFAEIFVWYKFIQVFSFLDALLLVLTGGMLGLLIIFIQGRSVWIQAQQSLMQGKLPTNAILHRGVVMMGGILILLPGLLSKAVGFAFVMPGLRHLIVWYMKWMLAGKIANGSFRVFMAGGFPKDFTGFSGSFGGSDFRSSHGFPVDPPRDVTDTQTKIADGTDSTIIDITPNKK